MVIIGLTGGLGSGKSTVAGMFADLGGHVISADALARRCLQPGTQETARVVDAFGTEVMTDGHLNRARLAEIVFGNPDKLRQLEAIVHPYVQAQTRRQMDDIRRTNPRAIVVWDIPLLFEKNLETGVDAVVVVTAEPEQQILRAMQRLKITREDAEQRLQTQMPTADKIKRADFVVLNNGSFDNTRKQVLSIWEKLSNRQRA